MNAERFATRLRKAMDDRGFKQVDLVRAAEQAGVKMGKCHARTYSISSHASLA